MEKDIEFLQEMFPLEKEVISDIFMSSKKNIDETITILEKLCNDKRKNPPTYEEALSRSEGAFLSDVNNIPKNRRNSKRSTMRREWKPPILGPLSDDFLKVPSEILKVSKSSGSHCKGCARLKERRSLDMSECSLFGSVASSIDVSNMGEVDSIIRRRMEDNVSQTRFATMNINNDNFQYLDDERLALMLQNQEFRNIVKSDPEFQQALQEDCRDKEEADPANVWAEVEESICFRPQDNSLDYGYERSDIVDPDCVWPDHPRVSYNTNASKMVTSLGQASRKRLSSIAQRFKTNRKSKTSKKYEDVGSFPEYNQSTRRHCWDPDSSPDDLTDLDSVSCIGQRQRSFHYPLPALSERSS